MKAARGAAPAAMKAARGAAPAAMKAARGAAPAAARRSRRSAFLVGVAAALIAASRFWTAPRTPDDYDALGFVEALSKYDLSRFAPHFPGYPVHVALGRLFHLFIGAPYTAALAASAFASAITAVAIWRAAKAIRSERAAWIAVGLYAVSSLPWLLGASPLSESTAMALCALSFALLAEGRGAASGMFIGLMLGARASYFPLAISWLLIVVKRRAKRVIPPPSGEGDDSLRSSLIKFESWKGALGGAVVGLAGWAIPFIAIVGPRELVALGRTHLTGHFADWGGSVHTRANVPERIAAFLRDWLFDGIAPGYFALGALLAIIAFALYRRSAEAPGPRRDLRPSRGSFRIAAIMALPYSLWALFGQNVLDQPRHLLPLVVLTIFALALLLEAHRWLALAALAIVLSASLPLGLLHRSTESPAAQMAFHVLSNYRAPETALFGGRSMRFVRTYAPAFAARERTWLAEVDVDLERFDVFPRRIVVTSEVEPDARRGPKLKAGPRFCRDERLERRQPCLQLFDYSLFGP